MFALRMYAFFFYSFVKSNCKWNARQCVNELMQKFCYPHRVDGDELQLFVKKREKTNMWKDFSTNMDRNEQTHIRIFH